MLKLYCSSHLSVFFSGSFFFPHNPILDVKICENYPAILFPLGGWQAQEGLQRCGCVKWPQFQNRPIISMWAALWKDSNVFAFFHSKVNLGISIVLHITYAWKFSLFNFIIQIGCQLFFFFSFLVLQVLKWPLAWNLKYVMLFCFRSNMIYPTLYVLTSYSTLYILPSNACSGFMDNHCVPDTRHYASLVLQSSWLPSR